MEVVATGWGGPERLELVDSAVPAPGEGEVTVEVRAAGVNPRDRKAYRSPDYAVSHRLPLPSFPMRMGVEAAGVVTAVGPNAMGSAGPVCVGDAVIAYRITGAYADRITVRAADVVPKPTRLRWEEAATLMLAGTTAAHVLAMARVRPGDTVLVHAASGGVGMAAAQLCALDGVRVIGTAGAANHALLRGLGVEPVPYGPGLLGRLRAAGVERVDTALDLVGTEEAVDASLALLRDRTRLVTVVAFDRARAEGFQAVGGAPGQNPEGIALRMAARLRLTALAQAGALRVRVGHVLPLAEAAEAHRMLERGDGGGRIVLVP